MIANYLILSILSKDFSIFTILNIIIKINNNNFINVNYYKIII